MAGLPKIAQGARPISCPRSRSCTRRAIVLEVPFHYRPRRVAHGSALPAAGWSCEDPPSYRRVRNSAIANRPRERRKPSGRRPREYPLIAALLLERTRTRQDLTRTPSSQETPAYARVSPSLFDRIIPRDASAFFSGRPNERLPADRRPSPPHSAAGVAGSQEFGRLSLIATSRSWRRPKPWLCATS
jgi:hypothetical protein